MKAVRLALWLLVLFPAMILLGTVLTAECLVLLFAVLLNRLSGFLLDLIQ